MANQHEDRPHVRRNQERCESCTKDYGHDLFPELHSTVSRDRHDLLRKTLDCSRILPEPPTNRFQHIPRSSCSIERPNDVSSHLRYESVDVESLDHRKCQWLFCSLHAISESPCLLPPF